MASSSASTPNPRPQPSAQRDQRPTIAARRRPKRGLRPSAAAAVGLLAILIATGCGSESAFSDVHMIDGTATYQSTAAGLAVSGSFSLAIDFYNDEFEYGDESDVYLHRLQLGRHDQYELDDGPDVDEVTADLGLPFVTTVGIGSSATITWSVLVQSHDPTTLCDSQLFASVYLSLSDELALCALYSDGHYQPAYLLSWSPDPCQ